MYKIHNIINNIVTIQINKEPSYHGGCWISIQRLKRMEQVISKLILTIKYTLYNFDKSKIISTRIVWKTPFSGLA